MTLARLANWPHPTSHHTRTPRAPHPECMKTAYPMHVMQAFFAAAPDAALPLLGGTPGSKSAGRLHEKCMVSAWRLHDRGVG